MKKILLTIATVAFLATSCSSGTPAPGDGPTGSAAEDIASAGARNLVESADSQIKASGKPVHLTKKDFLEKVMNYEKNQTEWVYEGDLPALIDFYADWCGPCRMAAPVLEELAAEYEGRIHVYKVDTEQERELAAVFGIQSIPAFLFVPSEGRPTMSSGIARTPEETKEMFRKMINELLLDEKQEVL